jgi:hopene-associated glycosyltransferase HpnB
LTPTDAALPEANRTNVFLVLLSLVGLAAWLFLTFGRAFFWLDPPGPAPPAPERFPDVDVIIPARNEAPTVGRTVRSLLSQDFPGRIRVTIVDDHSDDGTASAASEGVEVPAGRELTVHTAPPLQAGWTGKVWAMNAGLRLSATRDAQSEFVLFTDADIVHPPGNLRRLVARAAQPDEQGHPRDLVSQMVRLHCATWAEKLTIPAFVYFFRMLYPFGLVNRQQSRTAAAAGGVMLVRRAALERIAGLESIRSELIDDCALAARIKKRGPLWLELSGETVSLRVYPRVRDAWAMIARSAFTQLRPSVLLLAGTTVGLSVIFVLPPFMVAFGGRIAASLAAVSWCLMTLSYLPTIRMYNIHSLWALSLPFSSLVYLGATLDSARRHWIGRGGAWKGRHAG